MARLFWRFPKDVFSQIKTKKLRLDVPQVTELAQLLQRSTPYPSDILTIEEMVMALCP